MAWIFGSGFPKSLSIEKQMRKNDNPEADDWVGYGTALKPAWEYIGVFMKPKDGTFAENALKWGVAGLNIDGGRVPTDDTVTINTWDNGAKPFGDGGAGNPYSSREETQGRWPANIVHDGSEEVVSGFPIPHSAGKSRIGSNVPRKTNHNPTSYKGKDDTGKMFRIGDSGSAARFFYCAKASKAERNQGLEGMPKRTRQQDGNIENWDLSPEKVRARMVTKPQANDHPTVKPLSLMEYLCRLTKTPTGGIVLDPFMGSGTTGMACKKVGRDFIGIELDEHYFEIAEKRIASIIQVELL